jgi:cyclophilin family peptidyl-prolyl cis-trans isomerase
MNRTLILGTALALVLAVPGAHAASSAKPVKGKAVPAGTDQAVVLETTQGNIVIKLADKQAPKTCANFRKLVGKGFYDGTSFHRVIAGFMIQGGDPNTKNANPADDGLGGPGYTVPAEIGLPHVRGAIATARQGDEVNPKKESSGSQFFIDLAKLPSLDQGGYTVFGQVISGMDVVDKIAAFANDSALPQANGGGRNPGKKALVRHARLESLSSFDKSTTPTPASAPPPAAGDAGKAPADSAGH